MENRPRIPADPGLERLTLVDELDLLEKRNRERLPVKVALGIFTACLILALTRGSFVWAVGAVASFSVFLALMVAPIRRFERIAEIRRELADREADTDALADGEDRAELSSGLKRGTEADATDQSERRTG